MIKIEHPDLNAIAEEHGTKLEPYVEEVLNKLIILYQCIVDVKININVNTFFKSDLLEKSTIEKISTVGLAKNQNSKIKKEKLKQALSKRKQLNKEIKKHSKEILNALIEAKSYLPFLLKDKPDNINALNIKHYYNNYTLYTNEAINTKFKNILSIAFDYNKFSSKKSGIPYDYKPKKYWNRFFLSEKLDIKTCCYCNRSYTNTIIEDDGKNITAPILDHFIDKASFPILALSFYNLIPSCYICNTTLKGSTPVDLNNYLNPFIERFTDDAIFKFEGGSRALFAEEKPDKILIEVSPTAKFSYQFNGNIKLFKLEEIYQSHKDVVQEMIWKSLAYSPKYLDSLTDEFEDSGLDHSTAYRFAFSNYLEEKDFHKRPLAKFTNDIAKQLGLV